MRNKNSEIYGKSQHFIIGQYFLFPTYDHTTPIVLYLDMINIELKKSLYVKKYCLHYIKAETIFCNILQINYIYNKLLNITYTFHLFPF